ncbi:Protein CLP1 -like protein [Sesbania bispinosa]|nr:Protein CLP1 -like protein [Sesbania bispinosa]
MEIAYLYRQLQEEASKGSVKRKRGNGYTQLRGEMQQKHLNRNSPKQESEKGKKGNGYTWLGCTLST